VLRFLSGFLGISVLVCIVTFLLLKRRLGLSKKGNLWLLAFFTFAAALMVVAPLQYRMSAVRPVESWLQFLQFSQYLLMGWVGVTLLTFIFAEFIQFIVWSEGKIRDRMNGESAAQNTSRRIFLTEGVTRGLLAATSLASVGGYLQAKWGPRIQPMTLYPKNFPKEFDGLTLAQISDIHIGPLLHREFLQNVVDQVMSLNADIILITGDLVDGTVEQLRELVEPLKQLKAREGIYFCTGNHEYYSGANEWMEYLESIGVHVFRNSNVILSRPVGEIASLTTQPIQANHIAKNNKVKILLGGVFDWHAGRFFEDQKTDPYAAAKTNEEVACKILLAHNPYSIIEGADAGFNLQISGHTHAGQFYPFVFLVKLALKHVEGLYQINENTQLYVNRGTGYWGPPNRLGKWSEITHFTLKSKA
jgi:predicted MPP superfamily phosphohydrolase